MSSFDCEQIWADWDFAAEEAARARIASDFLATVAQAVRMASAEFDQMGAALAKTTAGAAA